MSSHVTREPTPDAVEETFRRIVRIGGEEAGVCRGRDLVYQLGTRSHMVHSCCCGGNTRVDLPVPASGKPATVCIVCDAATEFPRLSS